MGSHGNDRNPYPERSGCIPIGRDVTSIVFLHALAKPAGYVTGDNYIFDFADSADLLGSYEIEYEDGLITTVPLRYRWNILDVRNETGVVAYQADMVDRVDGAKFYALEWSNPRLGKVIRKIRLSGSRGFRELQGANHPQQRSDTSRYKCGSETRKAETAGSTISEVGKAHRVVYFRDPDFTRLMLSCLQAQSVITYLQPKPAAGRLFTAGF